MEGFRVQNLHFSKGLGSKPLVLAARSIMLEGFRVQKLHLQGCKPAINSAFWDQWETAVLGQILARILVELDFGTLVAWNPAIESAFWDHWETAVLSQILARRFLGAALQG